MRCAARFRRTMSDALPAIGWSASRNRRQPRLMSSAGWQRVFYAHANRKKRSSVRALLAPAPGTALWPDWNGVTRKSGPKQENAWDELCRRAKRAAGLDLRTTSLLEAIEALLDQIELGTSAHKQKSLVRLASLLIQLEAAPLRSEEHTSELQSL